MTLQTSAPKLAIDITRLLRRALQGRRPTGIDRVTLAYVRHFAPHARAMLGRGGWVFELGTGLSKRVFAWLGAEGPDEGLLAARRVDWPRCLLHTSHSGLESMAYLAAVRKRGLLPVFLVHDLIPITHPQHSRPGMPQMHLLRMRNASFAGAGLVCNSEATRLALANLCAVQGWGMPPTVVARLGVEPWARPHAGLVHAVHHPRPYFVCVGTIEPRKNHLLLLRVWKRLAARMGERTPDLLLIGQRGWMFDEVTQVLEKDEVARRHVREQGDCPDSQLRDRLLGARALLMPSQAEGFGLPVAEALACGVPVIASSLPVYREFAGNVPDYLEACDESGWAARIEAYCEPEHAARKAQLARLLGWEPPTWAAHFAAVESLLQQIGHPTGRHDFTSPA